MDQKALRELENRCIQDEPPACAAACPLHMDARTFVGHVAQGDWEAAWRVLEKTLPLPGILGRICDAPCRASCKRGEAGDPIHMGALERACVQTPAPSRRIQPLPAKGKSVAVVGGGLSGLTVAWELARKGYTVIIHDSDKRLGGSLFEMGEAILPGTVITAEIDVLTGLGVQADLGVSADAPDFPDHLLATHGAVYLALDAVDNSPWALDRDSEGGLVIDPRTRVVAGREGLFAGGGLRDGAASPVWQAAEGRWAATSIDRFLQGVSMTVGREKEGPYPTRLHTPLVEVAPTAVVPMADATIGYSPEAAMGEAGRCLQCECMACVKVCEYLRRFGGYPRKYAREIYNNDAMVMGARQANKLINSCSLCGLCETVCPGDFPMQDLCLSARRRMVEKGKMPPSAHDFALRDMAFSQSDRFLLVRHAPDRTDSEYLFFPGCQLCASDPDLVRRVYDHLRGGLSGGVGMMLGCCGAPAHWAGREDRLEDVMKHWEGQWRDLGQPRIITACAACHQMFTTRLPHIPQTDLWRVLTEVGVPPLAHGNIAGPLAVHDPCTTRHAPGIQAAVRGLLADAAVPFEELDLGRDKTECCGFGGLMHNANPDLGRAVAAKRGDRSPRDYLTYCAMCRDALAAEGKRALHLLDLFFAGPEDRDPAGRERPGWSRRQENRARLKARLCRELWPDNPEPPTSPHGDMTLRMDPAVQARLEDRRILTEDLQAVIAHAEKTGEKLRHRETGHCKAFFAPHSVTFWVEYSPGDGCFIIHNAYSHRMEVLGP